MSVGAACVWRTQKGWTGCRYHLGTKKEVFGAETIANYQALHALDERQESGHRYTVFVDSTSAINWVRDDALGPGQCFAVAAIEVCLFVCNLVFIIPLPKQQRRKVGGRDVEKEGA